MDQGDFTALGYTGVESDGRATFTTARAGCQALGGDLPNHHDADEVSVIQTACADGKVAIGSTHNKGCWSGLVDESPEGSDEDDTREHVDGTAYASDTRLAWVGANYVYPGAGTTYFPSN